MCHLFEVEDANRFGIESAILLQHIRLWTQTNAANGHHFHAGMHWVRCTMAGLQKLYPYMTVNQVRRALERLRAAGVVGTRTSTDSQDKAIWYTCLEDHMAQLPHGKRKPAVAKGAPASQFVTKPSKKTQKSYGAIANTKQDHVAQLPHETNPEGLEGLLTNVLTQPMPFAEIKDVQLLAEPPDTNATCEKEPEKQEHVKVSKRRISHLTKKRRCTYLLLYSNYTSNTKYSSTIVDTKEKETTNNTTLRSVLLVAKKKKVSSTNLVKQLSPEVVQASKLRAPADAELKAVIASVAIEHHGERAGMPRDCEAFAKARIEIAKLMWNALDCPDSNFTKRRCMEEALKFIDYWNAREWRRKDGQMKSLPLSVRTWVRNNYGKPYEKSSSFDSVAAALSVATVAGDIERIARIQSEQGSSIAF